MTDDELKLAPPQADASDRETGQLDPAGNNRGGPPKEPPIQFSLGEFLLVFGIVSVGLSGLSWMGPQVFAGICGVIALAVFVVAMVWKPEAPLFHLVWYALMGLYAIAIVFALVTGPHPAP